MKRLSSLLLSCCTLLLLSQCQEKAPEKGSIEHIKTITEAVDDAALLNADENQGDWLTYGRNYSEDRYSELTGINKENISDLGLFNTVGLGSSRGIEGTPLVVDGIMFATGAWSVVWAIDLRKGKVIWEFDPQVPKGETSAKLCCGANNRGAAMYKGDIFIGTLDGRLVSIDASTGIKNWEVMTVDPKGMYSITGAPRVVKGNILIGNGGAEFNARGYVSAYDAASGKMSWRFYTVPGDPSKPFEHPDLEEAAKTWNGEWWKQGGGGTAWDAIVYDADFDQVLIGVGNGAHWNRQIRSPGGGDNLYLSSIVAVDANDGSYKWHYQTTPGDTWDYTATQHIILSDMEIDGESKKVAMQAPKNGFFYVIDRSNGKFISADEYTYQNWAVGFDENGRPIEREGSRYTDGRTHFISPSSNGGHNWQPMSYNHVTGLVYIPAQKNSGAYMLDHDNRTGGLMGGQVSAASVLYNPPVVDTTEGAPAPNSAIGKLVAYNPETQKETWSVPMDYFFNGGLLSTAAELVFQAEGTGNFRVRDARTGTELWSYDIRDGATAPPVTYTMDGEQYVSIVVGWGGGIVQNQKATMTPLHEGTVYTFKIGADATPPKKLEGPAMSPLTNLKPTDDALSIGRGINIYMGSCAGCHRATGGGGAEVPDLARSSKGVYDNYEAILLRGALAANGMPSFEGILNEQDVKDLKNFIFYSADAIANEIDQGEMMKEMAAMQYAADQEHAAMAEEQRQRRED